MIGSPCWGPFSNPHARGWVRTKPDNLRQIWAEIDGRRRVVQSRAQAAVLGAARCANPCKPRSPQNERRVFPARAIGGSPHCLPEPCSSSKARPDRARVRAKRRARAESSSRARTSASRPHQSTAWRSRARPGRGLLLLAGRLPEPFGERVRAPGDRTRLTGWCEQRPAAGLESRVGAGVGFGGARPPGWQLPVE